MSCQIQNTPQGLQVQADNGQPSILFQRAQALTANDEQALNIWATAQTPEYKQTFTFPQLQAHANKISKTFTPIIQGVIDRLKSTRLAREVFIMSDAEIQAKLAEINGEISRQQNGGFYSNARMAFNNLKDKNVKNVQGWMKALTDTQKNGGEKKRKPRT